MDIEPGNIPWKSAYKILIGSVVPRPIGWISSVSEDGRPNLAPFSFFNVVCANPPTVVFCPMVRSTDAGIKDTLRNVRSTGEFVVNLATEPLAEAVNLSSTELPPDVNEFEFAGVTPLESRIVKTPRVAESPIHFECRVSQIVEIGTQPGSGSLVIGTIVYMHLDDRVLIGEDKINLAELKPIARLFGNAYCRVTDLFELERPTSRIT